MVMEEVNNNIKYDSEYIFDESQSLFNITEDEYSIVINRKQSSDKTLLIERLRYVIDYEYGKYCNSDVRKAPIGKDFESYFHEISCNPDVLDAQEAITVLLQSNSSQELRSLVKEGYILFDIEMLNSLKNEYWIDALLFYLLTHKTSTTAYRSLLNIINRYYGALSNLQHSHVLDDELKMQLNVLHPFVTFKKDDPMAWAFSNDSFVRKIIIALYNNQERKRNDLFRIKRLLDSLEYTCNKATNSFLAFEIMPGINIQDVPAPATKPWIINLARSNGTSQSMKIDADVIQSIRKRKYNRDGDAFLTGVTNHLKKIYQEYANDYYDDWSNILMHQAEILATESWYTFLRYYLKELGTNRMGKDILEPDYCYDYIVYRHIMSKPDLTSDMSILDNQLTDRLIDLLHKNESGDQSRLYEDCFNLKFITSKIKKKADIPMHELPQDDPIWIDTLELLNPILSESIINTSVMSIEQVKGLFKKIISNKIIYEEMRSVSKTFTEYNLNINAHLLLKIIGLMRDLNKSRNGISLLKKVSAEELSAIIFKIKDKKKIGNIRKHINGSPDSTFTELRRRIAIDIIDSYWKDVIDKKS